MATDNILNQQFPTQKNAYLAFDSLSLKQHIKNRLNESGVLTDQNFEGSYIATLIDIVAYTFNVLMFYLNKTSPESLFSDSQLYENMNRIVKLLDYKPVGRQTSTLTFQMSCDGIGETENIGLYTIPRYSYIDIDGIFYSFNEDITFAKTLSGQTEALADVSNEKLLYQGFFVEHPIYVATGQENEIVFLSIGDDVIIDHFNIDVYVKQAGGTWEKWEKSVSLYLEDASAKRFEIRYNEDKIYELKFGNNINGKKLNENDQVAIYYLQSDGSNGEVGVGILNGKNLIAYNTSQFNAILNDDVNDQYSFLTDLTSLNFNNDTVSTYAASEESVDSIRENAPGVFRSQYRLITTSDYENYIKTNFANLIHDVKVVNNWTYLSEHMKYYFDLGLTKPTDITQVLYNQVMFGDACNFNNIYALAVPKTITASQNQASVLTPAQKHLIMSSMKSEKMLTSEVIILDPVYVAVDFALSLATNSATVDDINQTQLLIIKESTSRRDSTSIKNDIADIFIDYFDRANLNLNQPLDIKQLTTDILNVNGVKTFYVQRVDDNTITFEGLSMLVWNPVYANDVTTVVKNVTLPYFKFPYLNNKNTLTNRIIVQDEARIYENVEF